MYQNLSKDPLSKIEADECSQDRAIYSTAVPNLFQQDREIACRARAVRPTRRRRIPG